MNTETEILPPRTASDARAARIDGDGVDECDWCGRPVHRETAVERGDGAEVVRRCAECEFGAD